KTSSALSTVTSAGFFLGSRRTAQTPWLPIWRWRASTRLAGGGGRRAPPRAWPGWSQTSARMAVMRSLRAPALGSSGVLFHREYARDRVAQTAARLARDIHAE